MSTHVSEDGTVAVNVEEAEPDLSGNWQAICMNAEVRTRPAGVSNPGDREVNWRFRIEDPEAEDFDGSTLFQSTNIEAGKAGRFVRFCNGLGLDPGKFHPDDLGDGLSCRIQVKCSQRDNRRFNNVNDVMEV